MFGFLQLLEQVYVLDIELVKESIQKSHDAELVANHLFDQVVLVVDSKRKQAKYLKNWKFMYKVMVKRRGKPGFPSLNDPLDLNGNYKDCFAVGVLCDCPDEISSVSVVSAMDELAQEASYLTFKIRYYRFEKVLVRGTEEQRQTKQGKLAKSWRFKYRYKNVIVYTLRWILQCIAVSNVKDGTALTLLLIPLDISQAQIQGALWTVMLLFQQRVSTEKSMNMQQSFGLKKNWECESSSVYFENRNGDLLFSEVIVLQSSLLLNKQLNISLYGFILFEFEWATVRGFNEVSELQTGTSFAIEAKLTHILRKFHIFWRGDKEMERSSSRRVIFAYMRSEEWLIIFESFLEQKRSVGVLNTLCFIGKRFNNIQQQDHIWYPILQKAWFLVDREIGSSGSHIWHRWKNKSAIRKASSLMKCSLLSFWFSTCESLLICWHISGVTLQMPHAFMNFDGQERLRMARTCCRGTNAHMNEASSINLEVKVFETWRI